MMCLLSSSDDELTGYVVTSITDYTVLCSTLSTRCTWLLLATVRECCYWPHTSVSSVWGSEPQCVVDSGMVLWDRAVLPYPFDFDTCIKVKQ